MISCRLDPMQISKLEVPTAESGTVKTSNFEPGEVIHPGMTAFTIGALDRWAIKVYVLEIIYGQISLGDSASVLVDSFSWETFSGKLIQIADQAEFTPRNVQTKDDRQTTVFEIELKVENPSSKLKPDMPADVIFEWRNHRMLTTYGFAIYSMWNISIKMVHRLSICGQLQV